MNTNLKLNERNKIGKTFSVCLIMFLSLFLPFRSPLAEFVGGWMSFVPDVLILIFFVFTLVFNYKSLYFRKYDFVFLAFLVFALISTVFVNKVSVITYIIECRSIALYYIFFIAARDYDYDCGDFKKIVTSLHISTYVLFVLGVVEKVFNKAYLFPDTVTKKILYPDNLTRVYSMLYNPNTYAAFVVLVLFVTLVLQLKYNIKQGIWFYIIAFCSILLSVSRNAFMLIVLIAVLLLIYIIVKQKEKLKPFLLTAVIAAAVAVCVYGVTIIANNYYTDNKIQNKAQTTVTTTVKATVTSNDGESETQTETTTKNNSVSVTTQNGMMDRFSQMFSKKIIDQSKSSGRIGSLFKGLLICKDYPIFGTGFGTYGSAASLSGVPSIYAKYGVTKGFYADNDYVKNLVETGIAGFLLFYAFILCVFLYYKKDIFVISLFISILWFSLFYNAFEVQVVSFLFWFSLVMLKSEENGKHIALPFASSKSVKNENNDAEKE